MILHASLQWLRQNIHQSLNPQNTPHIDELVQERRNSIANALELRLSCTNPSISCCNRWAMGCFLWGFFRKFNMLWGHLIVFLPLPSLLLAHLPLRALLMLRQPVQHPCIVELEQLKRKQAIFFSIGHHGGHYWNYHTSPQWWPLLGLLSWYTTLKSIHCHSLELRSGTNKYQILVADL